LFVQIVNFGVPIPAGSCIRFDSHGGQFYEPQTVYTAFLLTNDSNENMFEFDVDLFPMGNASLMNLPKRIEIKISPPLRPHTHFYTNIVAINFNFGESRMLAIMYYVPFLCFF
jgi:hypothetical protein